MSESETKPQVTKKGPLRLFGRALLALFLLLTTLVLLLQAPFFQTFLARKAGDYLQAKTGFKLEIDRLQIRWLDEVALQDLKVFDLKDSLMLGIGSLRLDVNLFQFIRSSDLSLENVALERAKVRLLTHVGDSTLNINQFANRLAALGSSSKSDTSSTPFMISRIRVNQLDFILSNLQKDTLEGGIDFNHLRVSNVFGELRDFYLSKDTVAMRIANMEAIEPVSQFRVNNLRTDFLYSSQQLAFRDLFLSAGTSTLRDSLVFSYKEPSNLSYFVDSVQIDASLTNSRLYSEDLALFAPVFRGYDQFYELDGEVQGRVSDLNLQSIKIGLGSSTRIAGDVRLRGLPDLQKTFINASLSQSDIRSMDLRPYLPADFMSQIRPLRQIRFTGQFEGYLDDFVANGIFSTNLGEVQSNINVNLTGDVPAYEGVLELRAFNAGELAGLPELGLVDMRGDIRGQGFSAAEADVFINATFDRIEYQNYPYTNIRTDAEFANNLFKGDLSIADPNIKFDGRAYLDLRDNLNLINVDARLDTLFLKPLNLSEKDIFISSSLNTDLRGLHIDSITGFGGFYDTYLVYEGRSLSLDSLEFQSIRRQRDRSLKVNSSLVDVDVFGQFDLSAIGRDIPLFIRELQISLENDEEVIQQYYAEKAVDEMPYYRTDFTVMLKDANPIIQLFEPYLFVELGTAVDGNFTNGASTVLSLGMEPETLRYNTNSLKNSFIDFSISKLAAKNEVLASVYASSDLLMTGTSDTLLTDILLDFVWSEQTIDFTTELQQPSTNSLAEIDGVIDLMKGRTEVSFLPSNLKALDQQWQFAADNRIILEKDTIQFSQVRLQSENQRITLDGLLSPDPADRAALEFNNFEMANLNPFLPYGIFGVANGVVAIEDFYGDQILDLGLQVDEFSIERFLVGNLSLSSDWDSMADLLGLKLSVVRSDVEIINVEGSYAPEVEDNALNLLAKLDQASINILEPFLKGLFSDITGSVTGNIRITGNPSAPRLEGRGDVRNGRMRFDYLNTIYDFEGGIVFTENEIGFRNLLLTDVNKNQGRIRGGIFHDGFKDFLLDISGNMANMQVLNTTLKDNELFYGNAFATGNFNVLGPVNNLLVTVRATTNSGTQLYIPISDGNSVTQTDFIHFVNFGDSALVAEANREVQEEELSGLRLDFDISVTPDAYAEIIFDQKAGDIIRARGRGNLKMQIDTNGEFNMFGDLEITQGAYNFTLYGIINKEFIIQEGSRISWLGDPYEATLDITALYRQNASLAPLVRNEAALNDPAIQRRYPTSVVMDLTGSMLAPEIDFSIQIEEYPQGNIELETLVSSFKFRLENDEQELNRQVFSLIILRTFSPENSFDTGGSGGLGRSVSELLSGQLSHYISQIDENLEVNLDLAGLDEQALNTFQLRLSYTFLDGRLRVTRDGSITNVSNEVNVASLAGDWTAEYLLTSDGSFRVKIFSRTNLNMANTALNNTATTTGLALMYTTSFDTLNELFDNIRGKRRTEAIREEEESEEEKDGE